MESIVKMPRLGVNDEYVTLVEWIVEKGTFVKAGHKIAIIETTKETSELLSETSGYIFFLVEQDTEIPVGEKVAVITDDKEYKVQDENADGADLKITEKAAALMKEYGLKASEFMGMSIVREKDVLAKVRCSSNITRSKANDIIIVCGGGLAKMVIDLINLNKSYNIYGYTDIRNLGDLLNVHYLGNDDILQKARMNGYMCAVNAAGAIAIDNTGNEYNMRVRLYNYIKDQGYFMPTLIHPSARIAVSAQIGEGVLVFENAVIGSDAFIGDDCIINTGAIVSHDCKIGNHTRISPGAIIAGNVVVGQNSLIGMGVTIYLGVHIGNNVIIGNGKNIVGDVPDGAVVK